MSNSPRGILVFSEADDVRLELLGKAHAIKDSENAPVSVALLGNGLAARATDLAAWGADRVYVIEDSTLETFNAECYAEALLAVARHARPEIVLIGASQQGHELGPRVASRLPAGCVSDCIDFNIVGDTRVVESRSMLYSGLGVATHRFRSAPAVLLALPHTFQRADCGPRDVEIVWMSFPPFETRVKVVERRPKPALGTGLENALAVVDVGQGLRAKDDLGIVEELAGALGAHVCCTRPLSSERGWFPEWLGLSGRQISPRLCLTVGVSGAIQHLIGIRGSETIVSVDISPDSAMLFQSDYGIIDDLYQFVPALTHALKARGVRVADKG